MLEWMYDGVNASIPRNAGPDCVNYLDNQYKIIETIGASILTIYLLVKGYKSISLPKKIQYVDQDRTGRKILLCLMSIIFGIEIGFKLTSRTAIYLLNPCHIVTIIQLYLLIAKPSPMITALFRIQLNLMNGPVLAFLFPEIESRRILADKAMYYLQHGLMLVIPYYLLRIGGVYNVEPLADLSWCAFAFGLNLAYHWWILQIAALPIQVNLSHILCPAVLDPFSGRYYRLWTILHQGILCPLLYKLFCIGSDYFLTKSSITKIKTSINHTIDHKYPKNSDGTHGIMKKHCNNGGVHAD